MKMNSIQKIEYNNQRLLTTEQLAEFYGTTVDRIKQNINRNKNKFSEGKHFFILKGEDLKRFKSSVSNSDLVDKYAPQIYLWTKRGASRHSKILNTDRAWNMFDELEETYFNPNKQIEIPTSQRELAKLALSANEETNQRVDEVADRVTEIEENTKIDASDYGYIGRRVNQRVKEIARGYNATNKDQLATLYKDINTGVKQITGVSTRSQLRQKDFDKVNEYINNWQPSTATITIIKDMRDSA